nr:MAG TPA: hypothetical protein [Caudoviricetes sp.]
MIPNISLSYLNIFLSFLVASSNYFCLRLM